MSENNEKNEGGIFDAPKERYTAKKKHKSDFKRQIRVFVIVLLAALIALLSYMFIIKPIVEHTEVVQEELPTLLDGEVLGPQNRILIMDYLKRDDILSVDVHNKYGDWGFEYDEEDDEFYLKGNKSAAYDKEMLQKLLTAAGYVLSMERITDSAETFSEYGLSDLDNPSWYVLTDREGNSHKLYIGDILPSNSGYYVRYDTRDAVYVLDYTISETLLAPVEAMISPLLAFPVGSNAYHMITNFALKRDGEMIIALEYIDEEERARIGSSISHRFIYPEEYTPSDTVYLPVFSKFTGFMGQSTLVYQPDFEDIQKYKLDTPKYDLYFEYMGIPNNVIFSAKNENGNYYAYSPVFDIISEVAADNAKWLDNDLIEWIERPILQVDIKTVDEITVERGDEKYSFGLESNENELLSVTDIAKAQEIADKENFKKFYQTILMTELQGYAELTSDQKTELINNGEEVSLTVKFKNGDRREYKFYPYETRKSLFTVDGSGEFYVIRDRMTKIADDAKKAINSEKVVPDANN